MWPQTCWVLSSLTKMHSKRRERERDFTCTLLRLYLPVKTLLPFVHSNRNMQLDHHMHLIWWGGESECDQFMSLNCLWTICFYLCLTAFKGFYSSISLREEKTRTGLNICILVPFILSSFVLYFPFAFHVPSTSCQSRFLSTHLFIVNWHKNILHNSDWSMFEHFSLFLIF